MSDAKGHIEFIDLDRDSKSGIWKVGFVLLHNHWIDGCWNIDPRFRDWEGRLCLFCFIATRVTDAGIKDSKSRDWEGRLCLFCFITTSDRSRKKDSKSKDWEGRLSVLPCTVLPYNR